MRTSAAVMFLLVMLLGGTYMYTLVEAVCQIPLEYRIGELDERFELTHDEAKLAVAEAESMWEGSTGENLFTYDEDATFVVNFLYDGRQAFSKAERDFRDRLDTTQSENEAISETYATLVAKYNELDLEHADMTEAFERRLATYNQTVAKYNDEGGAPPEEFEALEAEKAELDAESARINALGEELHRLAAEINELSERGNELVESYNQHVETYNRTFGESREFTQGDYRGKEINIYKFADERELKLVLLHELGHALSLDHVDDEAAILNDHLGGQPAELVLAPADLHEYERVCGRTSASFVERLRILFQV